MTEIAKMLRREIELVRGEIETLQRKLAVYEAAYAVAFPEDSGGDSTQPAESQHRQRSNSDSRTPNKTQFVYNLILKHAKKGITPAEIKKASPKEWTLGPV